MPASSPIIVAGMHRSGTSLVASLLTALSVDMGSRLLPRDPHNPLGYFEDVEFLELQRKILSRSCAPDDGGHPDWGWTETESLNPARFGEYLAEARALIGIRAERPRPWGWKDPRTTLLLNFWDDLLEDARYVLVYRYPWDVSESMQRLAAEVFLRNPEYAYRIWNYYNRHLLDFVVNHRAQCLLVSVNGLCKNPERLAHLLREKWGAQEQETDLGRLFHADLLRTIEGSDPLIDLSAAVWPDCARLLTELDERADVSSAGQWRPRPVRSSLLRPDVDALAGESVDLSVVIPCYEQGVLLVDAVASVERCATARTELIIINDGSRQPRTLEILALLKRAGYFVIDQPNLGLSAARNAAIARSRGRFILPLDDDNRIVRGFIEEAIDVLDSLPTAGVVYGDRNDFGLRNSVQHVPEFDLRGIIRRNYIDACAIFRRQVWTDCSGYDPEMSPVEDWELWVHAAAHGWRFHHIPAVTFDYRVRPGSLISAISSLEVEQEFRRKIQIKHAQLFVADALSELDTLETLTLTADHAKLPDQPAEERRIIESSLAFARNQIVGLNRKFERIRSELEEQTRQLRHSIAEIAARDTDIAQRDAALAQRDAEIARRDTELALRDTELAQRDARIAEITGTYGWRLLSYCGRVKSRCLRLLYRRLGLPRGGESPPRDGAKPVD